MATTIFIVALVTTLAIRRVTRFGRI